MHSCYSILETVTRTKVTQDWHRNKSLGRKAAQWVEFLLGKHEALSSSPWYLQKKPDAAEHIFNPSTPTVKWEAETGGSP